MKKYKEFLKQYIQSFDLCDFAIVKVCFIAFGALVGLMMPQKARRVLFVLSALALMITAVPTLVNFFGRLNRECDVLDE